MISRDSLEHGGNQACSDYRAIRVRGVVGEASTVWARTRSNSDSCSCCSASVQGLTSDTPGRQ